MKSAIKKAYLPLVAAALLAGCAAPSPGERVSRSLEAGDALYMTLDTTPVRNEISRVYSAVELGLAHSKLQNRDSVQSALTVIKLVVKLAGIDEIGVLGASSKTIGKTGYSNRIAAAAAAEHSGWLWNGWGAAEDRLARLGKLPRDTVIAVDFGLDFVPALRELEKSGADAVLRNPVPALWGLSPRELLTSLSGNWNMALTAAPGSDLAELGKCGISITLPDRDGLISRRIVAGLAVLFPEAKRNGNDIYLPECSGMAPVITAEPGRISVYSSAECLARLRDVRDPLLDQPEFRDAVRRLPASVNGAYYLSDRHLNRKIRIGTSPGMTVELPSSARCDIGVWRIRDGLAELRSISSEPLSVQSLQSSVFMPLVIIADRALSAPPPQAEDANVVPARPSHDAEAAECRERLAKLRDRLEKYRGLHGKLPDGFGAAALRKILPELPTCGKADYVYFGTFGPGTSPKLPLISDHPVGNSHPERVNILFADGSIDSVTLNNGSIKRLCSYLHTVHRYDEKEFIRLIGRASKLDAEGK